MHMNSLVYNEYNYGKITEDLTMGIKYDIIIQSEAPKRGIKSTSIHGVYKT